MGIPGGELSTAPMTQWISYIALFDYTMQHTPAQSHADVDGLSRQRCIPEDSDNEDAEEYLDKFMGLANYNASTHSSILLTNFLSSESLYAFQPTHLDKSFFQDLLLMMCRIPHTTSIAITDDFSYTGFEFEF